MDQQKLQELYKLHERAKRFERLGNDTEALNIYMEIHENFFANTSDLYERPAVILEKKHRFQEAIDMCEKAIELIKDDKISGTVEQFEKRITKIQARMKVASPEKKDEAKKSFSLKWNPKDWVLSDWVKFVGFILIVSAGLYYFLPSDNGYEDVYIDMSEMERESELEGSMFKEKEPSEFLITESMVETAVNIVKTNIEVVDASISQQEGTLGFGIITEPGTSKDKSENLAIEFIKALAGVASAEYTDLSGPNALSLGELYKHYDIVIAVGDSPENIIAKGTKNKNANLINWRD